MADETDRNGSGDRYQGRRTDSEELRRDLKPQQNGQRSPDDARSTAPKDDGDVNPGNNLYVSPLSSRATERDLEETFGKHGKINRAQVMLDPRTGEPRGFGFVTFETAEEADRAMNALDGKEFFGNYLKISKAKRGRPRPPTPGNYLGADRASRDHGRGRYEGSYYDHGPSRGYFSSHRDRDDGYRSRSSMDYPPPHRGQNYPIKPDRTRDNGYGDRSGRSLGGSGGGDSGGGDPYHSSTSRGGYSDFPIRPMRENDMGNGRSNNNNYRRERSPGRSNGAGGGGGEGKYDARGLPPLRSRYD